MKKPLHTYFNLSGDRPTAPTFGQQRAHKLQQRFEKAVAERRTLARAEAAATDPVQTSYSQRAQMVERRIDRLHTELNSENSDANK